MSYHSKIFYSFLAISFIIIYGCATSYAPDNWLPDTEDLPNYAYGGWITVIKEPDGLHPGEKWTQYSGEFISFDEDNIYLLYDSLYQIPKRNIRNCTLELDEKSITSYGLWGILGTVSTISNGKFLVITAPMWLIGGTSATVGESARDRYETENPTMGYWDSIKKFARFPQGISEIDLNSIKPIFKYNE